MKFMLKGNEPVGILKNGNITALVNKKWYQSYTSKVIHQRGDDQIIEMIYLDKPLTKKQVHGLRRLS